MVGTGAQTDDGAPHDSDAIEPGNSAFGDPTHGNRAIGSFFGKGQGRPHGRPQGKGGPRHGQGHDRAFGGRGQSTYGRPHGKPSQGAAGGHHRPASPYVTTTLTIPGAVPEGLPGTHGPRPKAAEQRPHGASRHKGPPGPNGGGGHGKQRGRNRNRNRQGANPKGSPADDTRGNEAPRVVETAIADDDIGNR